MSNVDVYLFYEKLNFDQTYNIDVLLFSNISASIKYLLYSTIHNNSIKTIRTPPP
ncbi:hypothetical protein [African swine fever virus]|nr:hypothetical protein [African swine fever virus]